MKDIDFNFTGFHGTPGRCHIRIARKSANHKIVVVCSQYKNYYGTSVTNAMEIIARKLFNEIHNNNLYDLSLSERSVELVWHDDVNWFEKKLVELNENKYKYRFMSHTLNLHTVFDEVLWIERYPKGVCSFEFDDLYSVATIKESGFPEWKGRPTNELVKENTGYDIEELFLESDFDLKSTKESQIVNNGLTVSTEPLIDLNSIERNFEWIDDILKILPAKIISHEFDSGTKENEMLWEKDIQSLVGSIFNTCFPHRDLFDNEYAVSSKIGVTNKSGSKKKCDLVIFSPGKKDPSSMVEVKRVVCSDVPYGAFCQDLGKLLLYSKLIKSNAYFLVCGEPDGINNFQELIREEFSVHKLKLSDEYSSLLKKNHIFTVFTKLVGSSRDGSVAIWKIAHDKDSIDRNNSARYVISEKNS